MATCGGSVLKTCWINFYSCFLWIISIRSCFALPSRLLHFDVSSLEDWLRGWDRNCAQVNLIIPPQAGPRSRTLTEDQASTNREACLDTATFLAEFQWKDVSLYTKTCFFRFTVGLLLVERLKQAYFLVFVTSFLDQNFLCPQRSEFGGKLRSVTQGMFSLSLVPETRCCHNWSCPVWSLVKSEPFEQKIGIFVSP